MTCAISLLSLKMQDFLTGVEEVPQTDECTDEPIYDLQGRKLSKPQQGINVIGNKKQLIVR